ncbi:MAG: hypothetical protein IJF49_05765 [Clostridia bacterium]|nr:hypothetical protein [Clostridia bacterium]
MGMKQCPTCKMTVNAENECPICHTTLTYEPTVDAEKEHIIFNKYYWIYFCKTTWFPFLCLIVCIVRVATVRPQVSPLLVGMAGLLLISIVVSIFQRYLPNAIRWKYKNMGNYAEVKISMWKYLYAAIAVLFSFFV